MSSPVYIQDPSACYGVYLGSWKFRSLVICHRFRRIRAYGVTGCPLNGKHVTFTCGYYMPIPVMQTYTCYLTKIAPVTLALPLGNGPSLQWHGQLRQLATWLIPHDTASVRAQQRPYGAHVIHICTQNTMT
uniref:Uncharacterized protein n=1 Tax=Rhipicephalus microplus TaxID=6941 RepID=A0A6G5AIG9_RHIMP